MKCKLLFFSLFCSLSLLSQNTIIEENFNSWPLQEWTHYNNNLAGPEWGPCWQGDCAFEGASAYNYLCNEGCDKWLISPAVTISDGDVTLSFMERFAENSIQYFGSCEIKISTGSNDPLQGDFVPLYTHVVDILPIEWTERTIDVSAYIGQEVYIGFHWNGTWTEWFIDNFSVAPPAYADGAITNLIQPVGTIQNAGIETVETTVINTGTTEITAFDVSWEVNGDTQTAYSASGINLAPGESINIILGDYDFSQPGDYAITGSLTISDDFNPGNNEFVSPFYNLNPVDANLVHILPEGNYPNVGALPIKIEIENVGEYPLQDMTVSWSLDGIAQDDQTFTNMNIQASEMGLFQIGMATLEDGQHEIEASILVSGDINPINDVHQTSVSIGTLWESFEGTEYPPEEWTSNWSIQETILTPPEGVRYYGASSAEDYFGTTGDTLYTPYLDVETGDDLSFYRRMNPVFTGSLDILWQPYGSDDIEVIESNVSSTSNIWDLVSVSIENVSGVGRIGFAIYSVSYGEQNIDVITSTANIHQFDKDLLIKNYNPQYWAPTGSVRMLQAQVKNRGANNVQGSEYSINLKTTQGNILQSYPGVDIDIWETVQVDLGYQFGLEETYDTYLELDFNSDQNIANNRTLSQKISGVPDNVEFIEIGAPEIGNLNFPFNYGGTPFTYSTKDISQSLYYQEELQNSGYVYGITYHYKNLYSNHQKIPLKVWVGSTTASNLAGGWHDQSDLEMVFDDTVRIDPGTINKLYIPFDTPVLYTNMSNLLFQHYSDFPEYPPAFGGIYSTLDGGPIRVARLMDSQESDYDPLPPYVGLNSNYSYVEILLQPIVSLASLSGIVYDENDTPMPGANLSLANQNLDQNTDGDGAYLFTSLPYTNYEVTASAYGYNDNMQIIELDEEIEILDFHLSLRPQLELLGNVVGSNAPEIGLQDVIVTVTGYDNFNLVSDIAGSFGMSDVYGNTTYNVQFSKYGYDDYVVELDMFESDVDMGTIILNQESISAYNVQALQANSEAEIDWMEPTTSQKVKLQNDADEATFSYANDINEDVWLGNKYTNEDLSTLQSVIVYWDFYPLDIGEVTLDVFQENGDLICSSLPFNTAIDTLMEVNMPNVLLESDFYVMVHWQDNPATTHALRIDQTAESLNSAYVKYPGGGFNLLSSFLGVEPGSFQIRVNILKDGITEGIAPIGYNLFAGTPDDLHGVNDWPQVNSAIINATTFNDSPTQSGNIIYAVEAIYEGGNAEVSFSNQLDFVLGTEDLIELNNMKVFPNPTDNIVTVSFDLDQSKEVRISVLNTLGQVVLSENPFENSAINHQMDLSSLTPGYYIIEIQIGQTTYSESLIKR